jgi:Flp pilus assembly protein TadG
MGLALDVGIMFIGNARMRRAVDAAALAAALQFRQGYQFSELDASAKEFLKLNSINDPQALVQICEGPDPSHTIPASQCPGPGEMKRKLVRVVASGTVPLAFLQVIGINSAPIAAEAISETASVDVVLVIDRSESMTYTAAPGTDERDPSFCNVAANPLGPTYQGYCLPFDDVKLAAISFVQSLYFPYDRVAVVTFDKEARTVRTFSNDEATIVDNIKGLTVFEGDETATGPLIDPPGTTGINAIYPNGLPSRYYDTSDPLNPIYRGLGCPQVDPDPAIHDSYPDYPSPAPCTTTNIGLGLYIAGMEFANPGPGLAGRKNSLWVTILLTDGVANAGYDQNHHYTCPDTTWDNVDTYDFSVVPPQLISVLPKCNSGLTKSVTANRHQPIGSVTYDAEDYAYDAADYVARDQNSLIFTIGLGANVITPSTADGTHLGELFLQYAAETVGNGEYNFAPTSAELQAVFQKIADNIATRLEH